jgi:hypothetical protein
MLAGYIINYVCFQFFKNLQTLFLNFLKQQDHWSSGAKQKHFREEFVSSKHNALQYQLPMVV